MKCSEFLKFNWNPVESSGIEDYLQSPAQIEFPVITRVMLIHQTSAIMINHTLEYPE